MKQITCPHCADTYPDFDVAHVCSKGPYAPKLKPKMKERIKELSRVAHSAADSTYAQAPDAIWLKEYNKKFAELIIQECFQACMNEGASYEEKAAGAYQSNLYVTAIKKHFGVEE
jgi:hypothetical protein